jgi:F-type H+-transporting ATPase subunit b
MASPVDKASGSSFPPFDPTWVASTLFWLVVTFGLLYILMSRVALPRLGAVMEERADKIAGDLKQAAEAQARADAAGQAYEEALAKARANAQAIATKARDDANQAFEQRRKSLEAELAGRLTAAEAQLAETKTRAMGNVAAIASDTANVIVERLTGKGASAADLAAARAATGA